MKALAFIGVDLTELHDEGVLLAVNERFFWPLGLSLTWSVTEEGEVHSLHIREHVFEDPAHHESIVDTPDGVTLQRHTRYAMWLERRIESLPEDERSGAQALRASPDVLRKWAGIVVREYDKTTLTHDVAYEDVAEAIDWLRIALDPKHPMHASLGESPDGIPLEAQAEAEAALRQHRAAKG